MRVRRNVMRTSESGTRRSGPDHRPQAAPKRNHDDQLSVRRPSANLGNTGRGFGLPPLRLPARRDTRDSRAGLAAGPAGRDCKDQVRALGIGRRRAHALVLLRSPANSARAAQAGSDAGRHRRVPRRDAGNRGRQHQPDLRADRPGHDRVPPHRGGGNGDCRRARHESVRRPAFEGEPPLEVAKTPAAGDERCQHAGDPGGHHAHRHDHHDDHVQGANSLPDRGASRTLVNTTKRIIRYGFVELLDDVSWWIVLGSVLSAVAVVAIPAQLFDGMWGGGIASMVLMLILSIPLYTCASCSTPMAAALALKGLSPGAVLVFLLAGPATNIGSLVVLLKVLGRHAVAAYLVAVVIMTLAAGFALNAIYHAWGLDPRGTFGTAAGFVPDLVKEAGAVLLTGLLILSMCRTHVPNEWVWLRDRAAQLTGIAVTPRGLGFAAAAGAAVLWLGSGLFTVGPGEVGMRLRFGRILASDLEPGLHFRWPWPFENHRLIALNLAQP